MQALKLESPHHKAYLHVTIETGARIGEIMNIRYTDIEYTDFGAYITVDGKTGTRTIPITDSVKMLLAQHKKAENEDDYIFWFSYDFIRRKIKIMLKDAGYSDTYMYMFRKSRATLLFSDLPEQIVKKYMGWTKSSRMAEFYSFIPQEVMTAAILESKDRSLLSRA